jgi:large subunit ribosomal protein L13
MIKTYMQKTAEVKRVWHLIDVKDMPIGRVATQIAKLLIGKHKSTYTPHIDAGDFVVVINAGALKLTGNKMLDKVYNRHSGRPDGFKSVTAERLMAQDPRKLVEHTVKGMLPKNKLQTPRMRRLKVFEGTEHTYANQFSK